MGAEHPIELDDSQVAVAEADIEDRLIVTAAAGQGKTEVVLARLESLAEQGVSVQDDVLVLSFSRAAVDAMRRRLRAGGRSGVDVRTFDSLASQILLQAGELEDHRGFGSRIRAATRLIADGEADLGQIEHLVVDEVQDLVGDRAELVLALVDALPDIGFTFLGDPLQGIYDFQLDDEDAISQLSAQQFLCRMEDEFGARRMSLTGHYRATGEQMTALIAVGDDLRRAEAVDGAADAAHSILDTWIRGRRHGGGRRPSLDALEGVLDPEEGETVAVLGATNYAVLLASEVLDDLGVRHVVRRRVRDMGTAPWVATALRDLEPRRHSRESIEEALARVPQAPADAWRRLKEAEADRRDHRTLDLPRLSMRLRGGIIPVSLTPRDVSSVVASTVHRAKGLEFDTVIELEPAGRARTAEKTWPTLRRRYVAVSRAREALYVVKEPAAPGAFPQPERDRWVERRFRGKGHSFPSRVEILNSDVVTSEPGLWDSDAVAAQALLSTDVIGEPVSLVLDDREDRIRDDGYLVVLEDGTPIATLGEGLAHALRSTRIVRQGRALPARLNGARIASVETAPGHPEDAVNAGLGQSGFWLVPRLTGLVKPEWQ